MERLLIQNSRLRTKPHLLEVVFPTASDHPLTIKKVLARELCGVKYSVR